MILHGICLAPLPTRSSSFLSLFLLLLTPALEPHKPPFSSQGRVSSTLNILMFPSPFALPWVPAYLLILQASFLWPPQASSDSLCVHCIYHNHQGFVCNHFIVYNHFINGHHGHQTINPMRNYLSIYSPHSTECLAHRLMEQTFEALSWL